MKFTKLQRQQIEHIVEHLDWPVSEEIEEITDDIEKIINGRYDWKPEPPPKPQPIFKKGTVVSIVASLSDGDQYISRVTIEKDGKMPDSIKKLLEAKR